MGIQSLVDELMLAQHGRTAQEELTEETFQAWDRAFIFDAMRGLRYGQSFCNQFGITDNILFYERNRERAQRHIRKHYL
jgi:hypothetical protein